MTFSSARAIPRAKRSTSNWERSNVGSSSSASSAREEDRLAFAVEVERGAEVDRDRQPLRKLRRLFGHVHEPALGLDGQVPPGRDQNPGVANQKGCAPLRGVHALDDCDAVECCLNRSLCVEDRNEVAVINNNYSLLEIFERTPGSSTNKGR
jgi:hypothetical protein